MRRPHVVLLMLLGPLACKQPDAPVEKKSPPPPPVTASFITDVADIQPGASFNIGAHLVMAEGWHIYWINPGETGLATRVSATAPAGFTVGAPRFPGPERFESPGGISSHGYEHEALVTLPVTAPATPAGPATFTVSARWLACKETCIPGRSERSITVGPGTQQRAVFERFNNRWPQPPPQALTRRWEQQDGASTLTITLPPGAKGSLFPFPSDTLEVAQELKQQDGAPTLVATFKPGTSPPPEDGQGVLRVEQDGKTRYFTINDPWPTPKG